MRFEIKRNPLLLPMLVPLGGIRSLSYVQVDEVGLHCKFGALFDERFSFGDIERVERDTWPWYGGLGWRTSFMGTIAILGSLANVVRVDLRDGVKARLLLKTRCKQLFVSLEEPDAFVAMMREKLQGG